MLKIALDKSARRYDADGRLHVDSSRISKANVSPYYGSEIPLDGLDPNKVYRLYRAAEELEKAAGTFNNIQILYAKHVPVSASEPQKELIVGSIGSDVAFDGTYLTASLCVWDAEAIAAIESDQVKELSCAYRYVPVMIAGEINGEPYDGIMTEIQGNHLSIVENGRAGPDVVVADSNPFFKPTREVIVMRTKTGKALFVALSAVSPKLAADSALPALVDAKTINRAAIHAMDAELDPQQIDNIIDAILDVEQTPEATVTAADEETLESYLKSLGLNDDECAKAMSLAAPAATDEDPEDKEEELKTAMDELRAEFRQLERAKHDVRKTVGDVLGMDSAEQVYRFALDHLKVAHKGVNELAGLQSLYAVASGAPAAAPVVVGDSSKLPAGVKRFSRG